MTMQEIESQIRTEFDQKEQQVRSEFESALPESVKQKFEEGLAALESEVSQLQASVQEKVDELNAARAQQESVQG